MVRVLLTYIKNIATLPPYVFSFILVNGSLITFRSGFVAVFGDSSCLEVSTTSDTKSCIFLLEALLESALEGDLVETLRQSLVPVSFFNISDLCNIILLSVIQHIITKWRILSVVMYVPEHRTILLASNICSNDAVMH